MADTLTEKLKELDTALERVSKKQKICYTKNMNHVDALLSELTKCTSMLNPDEMETEGSLAPKDVVTYLSKKVKDSNIAANVANEHKDYYTNISKLGKVIDKTFVSDISKAYNDEVHFDEHLLDETIAQHFFREGKFSIGETFTKESKAKFGGSLKAQFVEMYKILDEITANKNLTPAIEWAYSKRADLVMIDRGGPRPGSSSEKSSHFLHNGLHIEGSNLEFKLHRLQYIHLLASNKRDEAMHYARTNFPQFTNGHMKEIQKLMACLIYVDKLESSPYSYYFVNSCSDMWEEVKNDITNSCCSLLGLSYQSPLYTSVAAGSVALPKQLKLANLFQGKSLRVQPVELELGTDFQYHPIFACPVSREQTTSENPPMRLTCGHVISKISLVKLARGGNRLKCPYCPTEQHLSKATQVNF